MVQMVLKSEMVLSNFFNPTPPDGCCWFLGVSSHIHSDQPESRQAIFQIKKLLFLHKLHKSLSILILYYKDKICYCFKAAVHLKDDLTNFRGKNGTTFSDSIWRREPVIQLFYPWGNELLGHRSSTVSYWWINTHELLMMHESFYDKQRWNCCNQEAIKM
jgi:hypothetical protein